MLITVPGEKDYTMYCDNADQVEEWSLAVRRACAALVGGVALRDNPLMRRPVSPAAGRIALPAAGQGGSRAERGRQKATTVELRNALADVEAAEALVPMLEAMARFHSTITSVPPENMPPPPVWNRLRQRLRMATSRKARSFAPDEARRLEGVTRTILGALERCEAMASSGVPASGEDAPPASPPAAAAAGAGDESLGFPRPSNGMHSPGTSRSRRHGNGTVESPRRIASPGEAAGGGGGGGGGAAAPPHFQDLFELGRKLGSGAFSVVREARHKRTGRRFAVKVMDRGTMSAEDEAALLSEVSTQRHMRHPNIVRLVAFFDTDPTHYYLVTELMTGGELFDRVVAKSSYTEREAREVVLVVLDAVAYCHRHGIVHRDLKPENLLYADEGEHASLKLADFGFAVELRGKKLEEVCGTPGYLAPEIISGRPYGAEVDLWAIGVITYILLSGQMPFADPDEKRLFRQIRRAQYTFSGPQWRGISAEAKDFIRRLLVVRPEHRMTAEQALHHPWMTTENVGDVHLASAMQQLRRFHARRRIKMLRAALWVRMLMAKRMGLLDKIAEDMEQKGVGDDGTTAAAAGGGGTLENGP